jgi:type I restriction enzyme S subunit
MSWEKDDFLTLVKDITGGNRKFQGSEYLEKGNFPIIDQGDEFIAGYTNENSIVNRDKDVVIFGDHTKTLKFVNFDFCLGADGVKVLQPCNSLDSKFLYYFLKTIKLPDVGYSRHYKFLKDLQIPLPPLTVQKRIAEILDSADALKRKDQELLKKYDELAQAIFIDMFGDPVKNEKGWEVRTLKSCTTKIGSGATPTGGKTAYKKEGIALIRSMNVYDFSFKWKDLAFIDDKQANKLNNVEVHSKDVLFNITGASVCRCSIVPEEILPARVNQHVAILRTNSQILNPVFLNHLLVSERVKNKLLGVGAGGGAVMEAITKDQLENFNIIVPPIEVQNQFETIINILFGKKSIQIQSNNYSENLFNSLIQKAFKGELVS